jgi:2-polyprenyl-3-methyl-5-hydroxy-6-metoxy-1,4-benzoquinol methylase
MVATKRTDKAWEYYGKNDPYYGVLTQERYSRTAWGDDAKQEFFGTGERYVDSVLEAIREHFGPGFRPSRALDFGCGVGRLVLPLARVCTSVVGVDVSESMLAVAEKNAREEGLLNATFIRGDDALSKVSGMFEFIHSFIVFQHIPPRRGEVIFRRLVELLAQDGIGVLHVTYSYAATASGGRKYFKAAKQYVPLLSGMVNLMHGKPFREPVMQMNEYDINHLLQILQESGCHDVHLRFSETSVQGHPFYGVSFFFRKRRSDTRAHA